MKALQDVKSSLQFTDSVVSDLRTEEKRTAAKLEKLDAVVNNTLSELKVLSDKLDYMDNYARRKNIVVDGINVEREENIEASESKARQLITTKLGLDGAGMAIDGAFAWDQGRPRQITVKLQLSKIDRASLHLPES